MLAKVGPRKLVLLYAICPALLALAAALIMSKLYWGYFFARPGLNHRIVAAPTYSSLTMFRSCTSDGRMTSLSRDEGNSPERALASVRADPYEFGHLDILEEVGRRGLLQSLPPMTNERIGQVLTAIKLSNALEPPTSGYEGGQYVNGLALEALEPDGARLLFVAAHGGEVSNDHYPNYRLLFEEVSDGSFRIVDRSRYFSDMAGIEGAEWPVLFLFVFLLPAYLLGLPVLIWALAWPRG